MSYQFECAYTRDELNRHVDQWQLLAQKTAEANVFYEPAPFLAAIDNLTNGVQFCCIFIYKKDATGRNLTGFAPFLRAYIGPTQQHICYRTFVHLHCYLCTPLIHSDHVEESIDVLLSWINSTPDGVHLFGFYNLAIGGRVSQQLVGKLSQKKQPFITGPSHKRAFITLNGDADQYFLNAYSRHRRKEFRRIRRKLGELGALSIETQEADDDDGSWIDRFLTLENRGWKGERGFAMDKSMADSAFFYQLIQSQGATHKLILHTLWLDNKAIAMKCNLVSADGAGSFAFKITYEESYAKYSPGVLLELDNIMDLFNRNNHLQWMDSCADPNHPMIDNLWRERRDMGDILCGARSIRGRWQIHRLRNAPAAGLQARY